MKTFKEILLYIRHISFIAFLVAIIVLYPSFDKYKIGNICLIVSLVYIILTFMMIFVKNKNEEDNFLSNIVLCFLHLYICFVAYKYQTIGSYALFNNTEYFSFNFLMISICMGILCANKLIIASSK